MKRVIGLLVCIGLLAPMFSFGQEEGEGEGMIEDYVETESDLSVQSIEIPIGRIQVVKPTEVKPTEEIITEGEGGGEKSKSSFTVVGYVSKTKPYNIKGWVSIDNYIEIKVNHGRYVIYNVFGKNKSGIEALLRKGKFPEEKKDKITKKDVPYGFAKVVSTSADEVYSKEFPVKCLMVTDLNGEIRETGLGKPGDKVTIMEFYVDGTPTGAVKEFTINEGGIEFKPVDSFNLTPIFNFELGKKKANGDGSTGFSPGIGVSYLFFYKSPRYTKLSNLGFGFNISYSNTALFNNDTQEMKNANIATAGVVLAYKINDDFIFETVLGVNINGDDKFFQLGIGLGTLVLK